MSEERNRNPVGFLLAQVGGRSAQEFAKLLAPLGLTPAEAGILRMLRQSPGVSQQKLAGTLDMHASRLVAVVDGLEKRGLLLREPNPRDRRLYALRLTDAGLEMMQELGRVARAHSEGMCSGLTEDECAELARLLQRIAAQHGLTAGVHPGYRDLRTRNERTKPTDCDDQTGG